MQHFQFIRAFYSALTATVFDLMI